MLSSLQEAQKRVIDAIESTDELPQLTNGVCLAFDCYSIVGSMISPEDPDYISTKGVWTDERLTLMAMIAVIPLEDYIADNSV